jgi:transposase
VARSQWQIVWLLAQGHRSEQVAGVTGYSLTWVRTVARRYNAAGEAGIGDRRHANRGGRRLLTPEQEAALDQALAGEAPGGGRWTAAKVAAWMSLQLGRPVAEGTGWRALRRLDWRRYRPRPQHAKADVAAQAAFVQTDSASK